MGCGYMSKLSLSFIDHFPNDIEKYLQDIDGINKLIINKGINEEITLYFEYDDKFIKPNHILELIELYMKPFGRPELIGFNKYKDNTNEVIYDNPNICCEICYLNLILTLFDNDNINSFKHKTNNINKFGYKECKTFIITYLKDKEFIDEKIKIFSLDN